MPGPAPKRSEQRLGHPNRAGQADEIDSSAKGSAPVEWPEAEASWSPVVTRWYDSLQESGQAVWFEPSDVAAAVYVAEAMDHNLKAGKFSAVLFGAVWSAMGDLLTTEASRRRLRVELEKPAPEDPAQVAAVSSLADARERFTGKAAK